MEFKDILKKRRKELDLTLEEIGRACGVAKATVQRWESGEIKNIRRDKINVLAKTLRLPVGVLMCWDELDSRVAEKFPNWLPGEFVDATQRKAVKIPVLGYVKAGIPMEAIENIIDYEEISEEMARTGEFFALQIKGDSMEPRITEGDVVIVRKQKIVENGDIAVVLVNGDEATVKKFYKADNGISLISTNTKYDPFYYSPEAVNSLPVIVIGKVVELRAKF